MGDEILQSDLNDLRKIDPYWQEVWDAHFVNSETAVDYIDGNILRRLERGSVTVHIFSSDPSSAAVADVEDWRLIRVIIEDATEHVVSVRRKALEHWLSEMKGRAACGGGRTVRSLVQSIHEAGLAREVFMELYRYSDQLKESMTAEDCKEVFLGVLLGQADLTRELLTQLCSEYDTTLSDVLDAV